MTPAGMAWQARRAMAYARSETGGSWRVGIKAAARLLRYVRSGSEEMARLETAMAVAPYARGGRKWQRAGIPGVRTTLLAAAACGAAARQCAAVVH